MDSYPFAEFATHHDPSADYSRAGEALRLNSYSSGALRGPESSLRFERGRIDHEQPNLFLCSNP
jgi:hypothetical protein